MFIGIILIAIFMLSDIQMSIQFWLTGFIISMLVSCAGIVLLIIDLAKAIKAEKNRESVTKLCHSQYLSQTSRKMSRIVETKILCLTLLV